MEKQQCLDMNGLAQEVYMQLLTDNLFDLHEQYHGLSSFDFWVQVKETADYVLEFGGGRKAWGGNK